MKIINRDARVVVDQVLRKRKTIKESNSCLVQQFGWLMPQWRESGSPNDSCLSWWLRKQGKSKKNNPIKIEKEQSTRERKNQLRRGRRRQSKPPKGTAKKIRASKSNPNQSRNSNQNSKSINQSISRNNQPEKAIDRDGVVVDLKLRKGPPREKIKVRMPLKDFVCWLLPQKRCVGFEYFLLWM